MRLRIYEVDSLNEWISFDLTFVQPFVHIVLAKFFIYKLLIVPVLWPTTKYFYYVSLLLSLDIIKSIKDLPTLFKCFAHRIKTLKHLLSLILSYFNE